MAGGQSFVPQKLKPLHHRGKLGVAETYGFPALAALACSVGIPEALYDLRNMDVTPHALLLLPFSQELTF
jgi:hypothetical protein